METWEVNLREIKHNPLIGGIGQTVAFYYLVHNGFRVYKPVKIIYRKEREVVSELHLISAYTQSGMPKWSVDKRFPRPMGVELTEKQREYLNGTDWFRGPGWCYVAFKGGDVFLVEVRTTRNGSPAGLYVDVLEAKAVGFKPMQVIVKLLENWNVQVETKEL
jgi:hypothetical protein